MHMMQNLNIANTAIELRYDLGIGQILYLN